MRRSSWAAFSFMSRTTRAMLRSRRRRSVVCRASAVFRHRTQSRWARASGSRASTSRLSAPSTKVRKRPAEAACRSREWMNWALPEPSPGATSSVKDPWGNPPPRPWSMDSIPVGRAVGTVRSGATPIRARGRRSARNCRSSIILVSAGMAVTEVGSGDQSRASLRV